MLLFQPNLAKILYITCKTFQDTLEQKKDEISYFDAQYMATLLARMIHVTCNDDVFKATDTKSALAKERLLGKLSLLEQRISEPMLTVFKTSRNC